MGKTRYCEIAFIYFSHRIRWICQRITQRLRENHQYSIQALYKIKKQKQKWKFHDFEFRKKMAYSINKQ